MSENPNNRYVVPHPEGGYAIKGPNAKRASEILPTQGAAEGRAKEIVGNAGGGEVRVQRVRGPQRGQWRDSDTVAPGNDPPPPRSPDRRH